MPHDDPIMRALENIRRAASAADLAGLEDLAADTAAIGRMPVLLGHHHALTPAERAAIDDHAIRTQDAISKARHSRMTETAAIIDRAMPGHDLMPVSGRRQAKTLVREMLWPYEMSPGRLVLTVGDDAPVEMSRSLLGMLRVQPGGGHALKAGDHLLPMAEVLAVRNPNSPDTRLLMLMADMRLVTIASA